MTNVQIRLSLADSILQVLEKEAEKMGMDRNDFIKMVLGQYVRELKDKPKKLKHTHEG